MGHCAGGIELAFLGNLFFLAVQNSTISSKVCHPTPKQVVNYCSIGVVIFLGFFYGMLCYDVALFSMHAKIRYSTHAKYEFRTRDIKCQYQKNCALNCKRHSKERIGLSEIYIKKLESRNLRFPESLVEKLSLRKFRHYRISLTHLDLSSHCERSVRRTIKLRDAQCSILADNWDAAAHPSQGPNIFIVATAPLFVKDGLS